MKKQVDKSKITIVIMSIVFALSLSVTITLAAFSANKTGDVTLTFADGLTMVLDPKNDSTEQYFYYKISHADENSTTFTYADWVAPTASYANKVAYADGVVATLNKSGYVSYQIIVKEVISNVAQNIQGNWTKSSNTQYNFVPTGNKTDWRIELLLDEPTLYTISYTGSTITAASNGTPWAANSLVHSLYRGIKIAGVSRRYYFDDLAGRTLTFDFTIKAKTDAVPTF